MRHFYGQCGRMPLCPNPGARRMRLDSHNGPDASPVDNKVQERTVRWKRECGAGGCYWPSLRRSRRALPMAGPMQMPRPMRLSRGSIPFWCLPDVCRRRTFANTTLLDLLYTPTPDKPSYDNDIVGVE